MAQDASGAAGGTLVIPGEMAARVDRLPMSLMAWEICLIVQIGWSTSASTDGIAARLYFFPRRIETSLRGNGCTSCFQDLRHIGSVRNGPSGLLREVVNFQSCVESSCIRAFIVNRYP